MSRYERHGSRSLVFSKWHRLFLADDEPMIDLDGVEYCATCREPLVLIEVARDVGQSWKPTTVMERLARRSNIAAWCLLYTVSAESDDQSGCACTPPRWISADCDHGISGFRARRVFSPDPSVRPTNSGRPWDERVSPAMVRASLSEIRRMHDVEVHRKACA